MKYCTLCGTVQSADDDGKTRRRVAGFGVRLFSFNLLDDIQETMSLMHDVKCQKIMLLLSVLE